MTVLSQLSPAAQRQYRLDLLRRGEVEPADVEEELGAELAQQIFKRAGIRSGDR